MKKSKVLYLSQGTYENRPTWHYLLVDKLKLPLLKNDAKKGTIDLINYGQIVFSGFGAAPPEHIQNYVRLKYSK